MNASYLFFISSWHYINKKCLNYIIMIFIIVKYILKLQLYIVIYLQLFSC